MSTQVLQELVIDSFAGGGGASEGIRAALGRDPDIALNHDAMALAMHRMNHPGTRHIEEDVVFVDARSMCDGRPVGMLWMSPDCKHHSKAKGGKPRDKNIRGLAWTVVGWVKRLPVWQRPRVVFLENVEEFGDWGPLRDDGTPCPVQKGSIFKQFVAAWEGLGYKVDWRERRACDAGAPTIRKRLYMVMRRDGLPIVWPAPTHGDPNSEAVMSGLLKPWRTAAEIIDWSLPCPSIFDTSEEIKARYGIRAIRPLAPNTLARIAKGTMRYVVNAAKPFLVRVDQTSGDAARKGVHDAEAPVNTITTAGGLAVVTPFLSHAQQGGRSRPVDDPTHTFTASRKDQDQLVTPFITKFNSGSTGADISQPLHTVTAHASETHGGGAAPLGLVSAFLSPRYQQKPGDEPRVRGVNEPAATIVAGDNVPGHLVTPFLVPRYGEREGQEPRTRDVDAPFPVIVPTGNEGSLAAVHLSTMRNADKPFHGADEPAHTVTAGGATPGVVAAFMSRQFGASVGSDAAEPVGTITAGGAGKAAVVAAFLAQHNSSDVPNPGTKAEAPVSTITATGGQQSVVAAHLLNLRGSNRRDAPVDVPAPTCSAQGNHAAAVFAFLETYYSAGLPSQAFDTPLHTDTTKPRHGLVTVTVEGEPFVIVDIGMRMLTTRERANAQSFRPDYILDRGVLEYGTVVNFTLEQQGRFIGNSVCPVEAEALIRANYAPQAVVRPRRPMADLPLLTAAE